MSKLVNGLIPKHTECPFTESCYMHGANSCYHGGKEHTVEFSCGLARAFNMMEDKKC